MVGSVLVDTYSWNLTRSMEMDVSVWLDQTLDVWNFYLLHVGHTKFPDLQRGFFIIQTPAAKRKFQISKTQKYQVH
ncbi:hypothetical protein L1987_74259 [Smallanthus sonchifolius]|uniref:Uncharacterized protein n=1 Tax=Smallanthus sonchifolius TaxID=185202 RepID=A0ACB9A2F9_9ASTR|nr:hypothetical protein L1987_74259 [Smallanthus sonchifolius]